MENKFPKPREKVLVTIKNVNPYSVFVSLDEYPEKEGMIHISEISRKRVRDIRKYAKIGQKRVAVVIHVDRNSGHIKLSFKRLGKIDVERKMKEYKRELKAKRLFELLLKKEKIKPEEGENIIGSKLKEEFGELFKPFHISLTPEGRELLKKRGISDKWIKSISKIAEKSMGIKDRTIKKDIEIICNPPNGIEEIKKILIETQNKFNIKIDYISAPLYFLKTKTKSPKQGERNLMEAIEYITDKLKKVNGEAKLVK